MKKLKKKTNGILGQFGVAYCSNLYLTSVFKLFPQEIRIKIKLSTSTESAKHTSVKLYDYINLFTGKQL